ncbi:FtsJ-like methyltransferase family protein [Sclerotinia borealis F-4128]|uniref:FtsJ-like methyltransferase family protein n=1 Tax=Sclerotinia borealis (strain F-4128) TaxID=1432307 RepID=W9CPP4_SCLBF|nr:FtsJ-like methyltransferase family protein [Sclerotinia borealis F-4128]
MDLPTAREKETGDVLLQETANENFPIQKYLLENVAEFRRLTELRQQGWDNPKGDDYFQKQRHNADNADEKMGNYFFNMMKEIAQEMHQATCALDISKMASPTILDMCMAPGGFLATALNLNPGSRALGFSLPISKGGHKALLARDPNVTLRFIDITMLAADMGVADIPAEHPEAKRFLSQQLDPGQLFDLILCDGQVLRTHNRAAYRETREALRLSITQLAIGLEHVKIGGTMVVLLHKVEAAHNIFLLYRFNKFSSVKVFKSTRHHAKRSSFYMIATNIQSQHCEAILAVELWKKQWKVATFGTDVEYEEELRATCLNAEEVLGEFRTELVRLGRKVWEIQATALAKAPFIKK